MLIGERVNDGGGLTPLDLRWFRLISLCVLPGVIGFGYVWTADGGGDVLTCVPLQLGGYLSPYFSWNDTSIRRVLIPLYLVLLAVPIYLYVWIPKRVWLKLISVLWFLHTVAVLGIILEDD